MKIINITEEQKKELCRELARLTFEFRKDNSIECICFEPYIGLITSVGVIDGHVLEVTLIRDGSKQDLEEKLKEYNLSHQMYDFVRKFGFKIYLDTIDLREYTIENLKNSLINSVILYDRSGEFKEMQTNNVVKESYEDYAEIFPSLDNELDKALDEARMERDTEALREFTKSRLFQYVMNM